MTTNLPATPDVSVIVVTYDCADFVEGCLASVREGTALVTELVVADNASHDGTADVVRSFDPQALVVETGENRGFAAGTNAALELARGRHVLLLNPDAQLAPGTLDRLVAHLDADPGTGVVAPRLLYPDGTEQRTARAFPTAAAAVFGRRSPLTRAFPNNPWSTRYLLPVAPDGPYAVDWVSGACLLVRRDVLDRAGGLDEGFFMHWEDADLCHRVKDLGLRVVCDPTVTCTHAEGGSRRGWPPAQVRAFHAGAYRYWSKHHARPGRDPRRVAVGAALACRAAAVVTRNSVSAARRRHTPARHIVGDA